MLVILQLIVAIAAVENYYIFIFLELEIFKKEGKIHKETILLVIEDPAPGIGSGGATLNALLVIAEKLSAMLNYSVSLIIPLFTFMRYRVAD